MYNTNRSGGNISKYLQHASNIYDSSNNIYDSKYLQQARRVQTMRTGWCVRVVALWVAGMVLEWLASFRPWTSGTRDAGSPIAAGA
jgi:hypothetical protein